MFDWSIYERNLGFNWLVKGQLMVFYMDMDMVDLRDYYKRFWFHIKEGDMRIIDGNLGFECNWEFIKFYHNEEWFYHNDGWFDRMGLSSKFDFVKFKNCVCLFVYLWYCN